MPKQTIADVDPRNLRVLMRADFNVPLDEGGRISDDSRITAALPTIKNILERNGRLILISHLGRPKGKADPKFSLAPVARRLSELLEQEVPLAADCIDAAAAEAIAALQNGRAVLLENLRFHAEEEIKDKDAATSISLRNAKDLFAAELATHADMYVNDAFGTSHRDNASMLTVPQRMAAKVGGKQKVAGLLLEKELKYLCESLADPARPFVAILGGKKVSDKIGVIKALIEKVDSILIGGAMSYTFFKADGRAVGQSLCENDKLDVARELVAAARDKGCELLLPVDIVATQKLAAGAEGRVFDGDIDDGWEGVDIGPATRTRCLEKLADARTIVWNGPMGVFETPPFDAGTRALAEAVAAATERGATTIIGGGDSAAAVHKFALADKMSHISTGGGAALELLEGRRFPAIEILDEK